MTASTTTQPGAALGAPESVRQQFDADMRTVFGEDCKPEALNSYWNMSYGKLWRLVASHRSASDESSNLTRRMAEHIAGTAVQNHFDSNGPDYRACACCDNGIQIDAFQKPKHGKELTHKDDCLFVAAERLLANPAVDNAVPFSQPALSMAMAEKLDTPQFWLLCRKFSTAPEGEARDAAKKAVLNAITELRSIP